MLFAFDAFVEKLEARKLSNLNIFLAIMKQGKAHSEALYS